jgi:hypothetical protein
MRHLPFDLANLSDGFHLGGIGDGVAFAHVAVDDVDLFRLGIHRNLVAFLQLVKNAPDFFFEKWCIVADVDAPEFRGRGVAGACTARDEAREGSP